MTELDRALDGLELEDEIEAPDLNWSNYQNDIFDFVKNGTGHAVIEAVAGSGKTTTLVEALNHTSPSLKIGFVAFNKHIATELSRRAPSHVHVSTLHSLGLQNIRNSIEGKITVNKSKMWRLLKSYIEGIVHPTTKRALEDNGAMIIRLVSMLKATLLKPGNANDGATQFKSQDYLANRYNIQLSSLSHTYQAAAVLWQQSADNLSTVDYDDMVFASAYGLCETQKFDMLFVDEAQDLNNAQIQMVLKSVTDIGRIIAVGDRFQSAYSFRGADPDAIPNLIEALDAQTLPLDITYRCPVNIVKLAQKFVPHITARDDAPDGEILTINISDFFELVREGDMVVCRTNAPLVRPAFQLIRQGTKAVVLGRDIGSGLSSLIKRIQKRSVAHNKVLLLIELNRFLVTQTKRLKQRKHFSRIIALTDQVETIEAIAESCETVKDIHTKIASIFDDNRKGVTFSSIHRAKGGEADNAFILEPDLLPHPMGMDTDWERQTEKNLEYIAITRTKKRLYIVE